MVGRQLYALLVLLIAATRNADGCPRIISRAEWGARPPTNSPTPLGDNVRVSLIIQFNSCTYYYDLIRGVLLQAQLPYQFVHHSEGSYCDTQVTCSSVVRGIQNFHMDSNGWDDIGYR